LNEALITSIQAIEAAVTAQHHSSSCAATVLPLESLSIAHAVNTMGLMIGNIYFHTEDYASAMMAYMEALEIMDVPQQQGDIKLVMRELYRSNPSF
jgi:tetratricopeptide (TPR) repeat protein